MSEIVYYACVFLGVFNLIWFVRLACRQMKRR